MAMIPKEAIIQLVKDGWILVDPSDPIAPKKEFIPEKDQIQPASVDLRIGIIFRKKKRLSETERYDEQCDSVVQYDKLGEVVNLSKGEIVTILTYEAVRLPDNIAGTLFPPNSLSVEGVLILNPGHVDPGYLGRVTVRLINFKEATLPLRIGQNIFTMTLEQITEKKLDNHTKQLKLIPSNHKYKMEGYDKNMPDVQFIDLMRMKVATNMGQAVFDIYATKLAQDFKENYVSRAEFEKLSKLVQDSKENYVSRAEFEKLSNEFTSKFLRKSLGFIVATIVALSTIVAAIPSVQQLFNNWLQQPSIKK